MEACLDNRLLHLLRSLLKGTSRGGVCDSAFLLLIVYVKLPPGSEFYFFSLINFPSRSTGQKLSCFFLFLFLSPPPTPTPPHFFFSSFFNLSAICFLPPQPRSNAEGAGKGRWELGGRSGTGEPPQPPGPARARPHVCSPSASIRENSDERRGRGQRGAPSAFPGFQGSLEPLNENYWAKWGLAGPAAARPLLGLYV